MKSGTVGMNNSQAEFIEYLSKKGKKVIVISFGNPYLLANFPEVHGYLAAYGDAKTVIDAAINTLTGKNNPKGKLPVTINENFKFGHGLRYN